MEKVSMIFYGKSNVKLNEKSAMFSSDWPTNGLNWVPQSDQYFTLDNGLQNVLVLPLVT